MDDRYSYAFERMKRIYESFYEAANAMCDAGFIAELKSAEPGVLTDRKWTELAKQSYIRGSEALKNLCDLIMNNDTEDKDQSDKLEVLREISNISITLVRDGYYRLDIPCVLPKRDNSASLLSKMLECSVLCYIADHPDYREHCIKNAIIVFESVYPNGHVVRDPDNHNMNDVKSCIDVLSGILFFRDYGLDCTVVFKASLGDKYGTVIHIYEK